MSLLINFMIYLWVYKFIINFYIQDVLTEHLLCAKFCSNEYNGKSLALRKFTIYQKVMKIKKRSEVNFWPQKKPCADKGTRTPTPLGIRS